MEIKPNPVSNQNLSQIYTDVSLSGTKKKPIDHLVTIVSNQGYVNQMRNGSVISTQEICPTAKASFRICGDMYEDNSTVDTN